MRLEVIGARHGATAAEPDGQSSQRRPGNCIAQTAEPVTDVAAVLGPFFLAYHEAGAEEEFQVFKDYGQALSYMETPEVDEGAYRLFDSAGRRAVLGTQKWDVIVRDWSEPKPDEMQSALSEFLRRKGYEPPDTDADIRTFAGNVAPILEELEKHHTPRLIRAIRHAADRLLNRDGGSV